MTTMISEVYDAFIAANVPHDKARKAAEALSAESLATKQDIVRIERELAVQRWMLGMVVAGVSALVLKAFF